MKGVLQDKVAVITGSGAGIGKATALAMAKEGAKVVVNDVNTENAEKVAQEIISSGGKAIALVADISNFKAAEKLMQSAVDKFGRIDILHNNAGIVRPGPIWKFDEKVWDSVIAVNLKGTFNCIRHASNYMMGQKWGRIINASSGARLAPPGDVAYSGSKAGIVGITTIIAVELAPYGITCNAYQPTAATPLTVNEHSKTHFDELYRAGLLTADMHELLVNPPPAETVPPLIMYLCTDEAADITGKVFDIAGNVISLYTDPSKKNTVFNQDGWTVHNLKPVVRSILLK